MYQDSKRTCTATVLLIKPFVWWHSRCRCRRGFVNSLMSRRGMASEIHEIFYAFGPLLDTFMSVGIWLKYFRRKLLQFE